MDMTHTIDENDFSLSKLAGDSTEPDGAQARVANSPDDSNCAICLGKLENKSFTDSCFHEFCFSCLREWSKVKPECPLCKQPFASIIHSVRSNDDYDQLYVGKSQNIYWSNPGLQVIQNIYRPVELRRHFESSMDYYPPYFGQSTPYHTDYRKRIYRSTLWVQPSRTQSRFREANPEFYSKNPACTHRLIPWLSRELRAILFENVTQSAFLIDMILELLLRYNILSPEFNVHLDPYLQPYTSHFAHEFYNFARSPYEMEMYDSVAIYNTPGPRKNTRSATTTRSTDFIDLLNLSSSSPTIRTLFSPFSTTSTSSSVTIEPLDLDTGLPGSSGMSRNAITFDNDSDSDCVIVKVLKPIKERTPEIISINSSSSDTDRTHLPALLASTNSSSEIKHDILRKVKSSSKTLRKQRPKKKMRFSTSIESKPLSDSETDSDFEYINKKLNSIIEKCYQESKNSEIVKKPKKSKKHKRCKHKRTRKIYSSSSDNDN